MNKTILTSIVGSTAHGLATEKSDVDYRGCFVTPTSKLLSLNPGSDHTSHIGDNVDDTAWEVEKFLKMALQCNPTVLEVFLAPVHFADPWGYELRSLFPYVLDNKRIRDAFIGYGLNQRKKFLDDSDKAPNKFAVAYLRTLYQAYELLKYGTFPVKVSDTVVGPHLKAWKFGNYTIGEVMDLCYQWQHRVEDAYLGAPVRRANIEPINEFLLRLRKENW